MAFLKTEDGHRVLNDMHEATPLAPALSEVRERPAAPAPGPPPPPVPARPLAPAPSQARPRPAPPATPTKGHLKVDVEFYEAKSQKLGQENEDLRSQLFELQNTIRLLQSKVEEQGHRLKHADVDLRTARQL